MPASLSPHLDTVDFFEGLDPKSLIAAFGSPLYVYNERILRNNLRTLKNLVHLPEFDVNYSVKANANPHLLRIVREEGLVVDAMSPGELALDRMAGFPKESILYISNNNSREEMANAIAHGVLVSVDSLSQLEQYGSLNPGGSVMVRMNPGIGDGASDKVITAGKATKFGIVPEKLESVLALLTRYNLTLAGINQHIGSLFMHKEGYLKACAVLLNLAEKLPKERFANLRILDFGGGFGIPYHKHASESPLDMKAVGEELESLLLSWQQRHGYLGRFLVEPGRYAMAEAGVLLGTVVAVKDNGIHHFTGTDIGFSVLMRPVLYDSYHEIEIYPHTASDREELAQTVTGNICESGDILAKNRLLPRMEEGDIIALLDAGAYGMSMSSNYTQRFRPAEICITAGGARLIRRRDTIETLLAPYQGLA
ncbi:MAG: diaminopimelate decarboxylase [Desulfovibrio sp.]|nr:diaminopimelate decarboxylase [Desulfovibrio sp.]